MSVSKNVLADALGIPEENISCKYCYFSEIGLWCNFYSVYVRPDNFCSFFFEKNKDEKQSE